MRGVYEMKCNNCGSKVGGGTRFCTNCGKEIDVSTNKNTNKKKLLITSIAAVLVLVIGACFIFNSGILNPLEHNLNLGYKYLEEGKYEEAILAFNKVLEIDDNNAEAVIGIADAYIGMDKVDVAIEYINNHLRSHPIKTELYDKLVDIYITNGDYQGAREIISRAAENGYEFDVESLDGDVKEKVVNGKYIPTGYQTGRHVVETDSKVISVNKDGLKIRNSNSEEERTIVSGKFEDWISTDGKDAYFCDKSDYKIKKVNIDSGNVEEIATAYEIVPDGADPEMMSVYILGYCDGFLYFQEWYGPGWSKDFIVNTNTKECNELKTSVGGIGEFAVYKNKIYYVEMRMDARVVSIYEADADGENEKEILKNAMNFDIIGSKLYFSQIANHNYGLYENVIVRAYDLNTKQLDTVAEVKGNGQIYFADFGYGYGQTSESDVYGIHIDMYDGRKTTKKGYITDSGSNYMICRESSTDGTMSPITYYSVVYEGKMSDAFAVGNYGQVIGYFGGKVYYSEYSEYGNELKSYTVKFQ